MICETGRLRLRPFKLKDAGFILQLLNEPTFIENIADKGVRTLKDARAYLREGPMASYARFGFGLNLVELRETQTPIGMCGLLKRESLDDVDIGYAFLAEYRSLGYALESARAIIELCRQPFKFPRIVAVVNPGNQASIRLLGKLGFVFERMCRLDPKCPEIAMYACDFSEHQVSETAPANQA